MAEYIERETTCKDCLHFEPCFEYGNILDPLHGGVKCDSFKPAADVVEVVRCEKCKFAEMVVNIIGDPHLFCKECNFREVDFDDFCSHGKRSSK